MKKDSFTLIEMLVVIAIIAILAGMVMPALGNARASGKRTSCMNNHKQLVTAMTIYAGDNDNQMIYKSDTKPYSKVMNGMTIGSITTREYVPKAALMCSIASTALKDDATNAIGMINAYDGTTKWLDSDNRYKTFGRFAKENGNTITYIMERMKAPGELVLFADTYKRGKDESYWTFLPNESSTSGYFATLAHINTCVTAFADGRVEALNGGKLKEFKIVSFNNSEFDKDEQSAN